MDIPVCIIFCSFRRDGYRLKMKTQQASETSSASTTPLPEKRNDDLTLKELDDKVNEGIKLYSRGEYKEAIEIFHMAAERNHPVAQYHFGRAYEHGRGIQQDYAKACEWYQYAANQGHVEARYNLDDIHRLWLNISKDDSGVNESSSRNHPRGQKVNFKDDARSLEAIVYKGWQYRYKHNYKAAMACFIVAENGGSPAGWEALCHMYGRNSGVLVDVNIASKYYHLVEIAAEKGDSSAQYYLGIINKKGYGSCTEINEGKKLIYFERAATQGYAKAQYALGNIYRSKSNYKKAREWLQRAADQGHVGAQTILIIMDGDDVSQNERNCHALYFRSIDQLHRNAQYEKRVFQCYRQVIDQIIKTSSFPDAMFDMQRGNYGKCSISSQLTTSINSSFTLDNGLKFIVAKEVSLALRAYRRNREHGNVEDSPKEYFPAANLDALFIKYAERDYGVDYPDENGRYWWRLHLQPESLKDWEGKGTDINRDYYWMKDEKRGWLDYKKGPRWFTVHHAPTNTKIEGFSWRIDAQSSCISYTECCDIKLWMENKDENYLNRKKQERLSSKNNVSKMNTRKFGYIRNKYTIDPFKTSHKVSTWQFGYTKEDSEQDRFKMSSKMAEIALAPLLNQCVAVFADYRQHRENGNEVDSCDEFPGLGFERLELSSSEANLWPDEDGRYWWRSVCKDGEVINNDFYWKKSVTNGWPDKSGENRYWFVIYRKSTGMEIDGFSYGVDPICSGENDSYRTGIKYNELFGFSLQYYECGAVKEWMEKKDRSHLARLDFQSQTEIKQKGQNSSMVDCQLIAQAMRHQLKVRRILEQTQINIQETIGGSYPWKIKEQIDLQKEDFPDVKLIIIGDDFNKLRVKILTAYIGKKYLEGMEGYVAPFFEDYRYWTCGVKLSLSECAVLNDYPIESKNLESLFSFFLEKHVSEVEFSEDSVDLASYKYNIYVLVYSVISWASYEHIKTIWIPLLKRFIPDASYILVAGDIELRNDLDALKKLKKDGLEPVSYEMGLKLASDIGAITFTECSAMTGENLTEVFQQAIMVSLMTTKQARDHKNLFYKVASETIQEQEKYERLIEQKILSDKFTTRRPLTWKKPIPAEPPRSYFLSEEKRKSTWELDLLSQPSSSLEEVDISEKDENLSFEPPMSKRITVTVPQSDFKEEIDTLLTSESKGNNRKEWISLLTHIATHPLGLSIAGWKRLESLYYSLFFENNPIDSFWLIDIQNTFSVFLKNPELNYVFEQWVMHLLSSLHLRVRRLIQENKTLDQNDLVEKAWKDIRDFLKKEFSPEIDGFLNKEIVQIAYIECFLSVLQFLKQSNARESFLCLAVTLSLYRDRQKKMKKATALYALADKALVTWVRDWQQRNCAFLNPRVVFPTPQNATTLHKLIEYITNTLQKGRIALQARSEDGVLTRYEEMLPLQEKVLNYIVESIKMLWQASIQRMGIAPPCTYTLVLLASWARGDSTLYSDLEFLLLIGPHKGAEAQFAEDMQSKWIANYFAQCFELFSLQILLLGEERSHYLENTTYCVGIHLDDLLLPFRCDDSFFGAAGSLAFKFELGERSLIQEFGDHFRTISVGGGVTLQGTENGYPIIGAVSSYDAQFFYGDEDLFKEYLHQRHAVLSNPKGLGAYTSRTIIALLCNAVTLSFSMKNGKILLQEISAKKNFLSIVSGLIKVLSIYHGLRYGEDKDELTVMNTRERCRELVKNGLINKRLGHCLEMVYNFCSRFRSLSYSSYNRDHDSWLLFGKMLGAPSKFALTKHLWQVYPKIWKEVVVMLHDVMYPLNHAFSEWADLVKREFNPIRPFSVSQEALERYEQTLANDGLNIAHRFNEVCSEILIGSNVTHGAILKRFTKGWWEFLLVSLQHLSVKERQDFWIMLFSAFSYIEREQFIDEWDTLMQDSVNFDEQHGYFTEIEKEIFRIEIAVEFIAMEKNLFFDDAWTISAYRKQKQWQKAVGGLFSNVLRHHSNLEDAVIQKKSVVVGCLDPNINSRELSKRVQQGEKISDLFMLKQEKQIALINDEIRAFNEAKDNQSGKRHIVLFFENIVGDSIHHFCLKIFPENPGMEYTMTLLDYGLGGDELPDVWLWRIYTSLYPDGIAALLMEDLRGLKHTPKESELMRNLSQVKIENPGALFAINTESFTRHFLRVLLSMPEDDKPNDYYLRPANLKSNLLFGFLLYRVDNERSMYVSELFEHSPSFLDGGVCNPEKADSVLKVKTVIYCMENMGKALSGSVIERFVRLNMKMFLKRWLAQINIWNAGASEIFKSTGIMPNISASSSSSSAPFLGEEPFAIARMHYNGNLYKHGVFHSEPNYLHVKESENFCLTVMPVPMDKFMSLYLMLEQVKQFFEEQKAKGKSPTGLEVLQAMRPDQYKHYHENLKPALRIGTKETNTKRLAKIVFDRFTEVTKDGYNRDQESSSVYRTMVTSALGELMEAKDYEAVLQNRQLGVGNSAADTVVGLVSTLRKHELSHNWPDEIQMVEHILLERFYDILKAPIVDTANPYSFFSFDSPMVKRCNQILTEFTNLSLNNKVEFRRCFLSGKKKGDWNISAIHPEVKRYVLYLLLNEPMHPGEPVLRKLNTSSFKEMRVLDEKILLDLLRKYGKTLEKAIIITTFNPYQISGFIKCLAACVNLRSLEFKIDSTKEQRTSRVLKSLECNLPELQKLTLSGFEGIESLTVKAPKLTQLTLRSLLNLTSIDANMQKLQFIGLYHCPQIYSHRFQYMIIGRLGLDQKMPVIMIENVKIKETFFMKVMEERLQYEPDILSQITCMSQFTVRQWLALDLIFLEECNAKEYKVYLSKALDQNADLKMLYSNPKYKDSFAKALIGAIKSLSKVCPALECVDICLEGSHKDTFMAALKLACDEELAVNINYNGVLLYGSQLAKAETSSVSAPGMRK